MQLRVRKGAGGKAKSPVTVDDAQRAEVESFLAALDDDDDVQTLYVGLA